MKFDPILDYDEADSEFEPYFRIVQTKVIDSYLWYKDHRQTATDLGLNRRKCFLPRNEESNDSSSKVGSQPTIWAALCLTFVSSRTKPREHFGEISSLFFVVLPVKRGTVIFRNQ